MTSEQVARRPRATLGGLYVAMAALAVAVPLALVSPSPTGAAPSNPQQRYAVLIVCNQKDPVQKAKEDGIVLLIRKSMAEQDLPREMLPILVYHTDQPSEARYCKTTLGITSQHVVFLGLAEHEDLKVQRVILRENNVSDPQKAVERLFLKAFKLVTGMDLPTTMPPVNPPSTPDPTGSTGVRVMQPQTCQSVKRPGGEPMDPTDTFGRRESVYISFQAGGLQVGSQLQVKWYRGEDLVHTSNLTSNKAGDFYVWFRLDPKPTWVAGRYRAEIFADGRHKTTLYYRVRSDD